MRENKLWRLTYKKLPNETVIEGLMPVLAQSRAEAIRLALIGLTFSNIRKEEVQSIEVVSCTEIKPFEHPHLLEGRDEA